MNVKQSIRSTAVVGSGYMGGGIAQVLAMHGHAVRLGDVDEITAQRARTRLIAQAKEFEARGLMPTGAADTIERNISAATIDDAVAGADYVTEAVPEVREIKGEILRRISSAAPSDAIISTNTSAIPIGELGESVTNPERFVGVHWMNPVPFIPGVELIAGPKTAPKTLDVVEDLITSLGKKPTRVADTPGFVANRLQFALFKEAVQMVEDGVATPAQIDAVVTNSFGFRLSLFGPFAIGDMAGLDVYAGAFRTLEEAYGQRFAVPKKLKAVVEAGNLGLKTGRGFLDVDAQSRDALVCYRDDAYARLSQLRAALGAAPGL